MIYRNNLHKESGLIWNPLVMLETYLKESIHAYLPSYFHSIHIGLPLDCRLLPSSKRLILSDTYAEIIKKGDKHKLFFTPFLKRNFESNLYDNLSPPILTSLLPS